MGKKPKNCTNKDAKRPKNCLNKDVDTRELVGEDTSLGVVTIDIIHRAVIEINNGFETMTLSL